MPPLAEISTAIPVIKTMIDLLRSLVEAPAKRRKLRFDEFFRPLHDAFQEVHINYSAIIRALERGLPMRDSDGFLNIVEELGSIDESRAVEIVKRKKAAFETARAEREVVRDWLRNNATAILAHVTETAERRYLYALLVYFLPDDHVPFPGDETLDRRIAEILTRGGNSATNTPTTRLSRDIRGRLDCDEVRAAAKTAIDELNQRCSDVIKAYVALTASLIEKTA